MHYQFSLHKKSETKMRLDWIEVARCKQFKYLDLLFQENRMTYETDTH